MSREFVFSDTALSKGQGSDCYESMRSGMPISFGHTLDLRIHTSSPKQISIISSFSSVNVRIHVHSPRRHGARHIVAIRPSPS